MGCMSGFFFFLCFFFILFYLPLSHKKKKFMHLHNVQCPTTNSLKTITIKCHGVSVYEVSNVHKMNTYRRCKPEEQAKTVHSLFTFTKKTKETRQKKQARGNGIHTLGCSHCVLDDSLLYVCFCVFLPSLSSHVTNMSTSLPL